MNEMALAPDLDPFVARIPGSKSLTNRALVLAAQRMGKTAINNALYAEDTDLLAKALDAFHGLEVSKTSTGYQVLRTHQKLIAPDSELFLGGAGTPARLLISFAASADGITTITGNKRLCERPMGDLLQSLGQMGIRVECLGTKNCLPVRVHGSKPATSDWTINGSISSQFVTSLLLFAAQQSFDHVVIRVAGHLVSRPYVEITVQMLQDCGISVDHSDLQQFIIRPGECRLDQLDIESDASGMSYFLSAAAITRTHMIIPGIGRRSAQGDLRFAEALRLMGCHVDLRDDEVDLRGASLHGIDVDMESMPDMVLTLAATAAQAVGPTYIRNIANLRFKECDRVAATVTELRRLGVEADADENNISIRLAGSVRPAFIRTYNDHRVAMSFGVLQLLHPSIEIEEPDCVGKSFPGFWDELRRFEEYYRRAVVSGKDRALAAD
jgi:3-phosphoshikimate 1-carboxyvinyltransferase